MEKEDLYPLEKLVFPAGKYKGKRIDQVPRDYLIWFYESGSGKNSKFKRSILRFIEQTKGN